MLFTLTSEKHPTYDAFRIMAKEDNKDLGIKSGDLGGFLSKEENLDSDSSAWVYDESVVLGESLVTGNAVVKDSAILQNITVGFNSVISNIFIRDCTFDDTVKVYTREQNGIVIADQHLSKKVITAKRFYEGGHIFIGYGNIFTDTVGFERHTQLVQQELPSEYELCSKYIKLITDCLQ